MFESRVRKTALQMRRVSQEILLLHVVEGSHMQTKPITEDEDPWIPTAQQDQETLREKKFNILWGKNVYFPQFWI